VRAVWLREFGPPSVLVPGSAPEPHGDVVIDVAYANITFVETQVRAGRGPFPVTLPAIPGNGVGGYAGGRRVIASLGGAGGGYAERVAVDAAVPIEVPDGVALDDAVALLADGRTALMLTDAVAVAPGERVLVLAAAGGVGTLLLQLVPAAVGAVGSAAKLDVVRSFGAEAALYDDAVGPGRAYDVVFDGVGGPLARAAFARIVPGGRMLSYGLASGEWAGISAEAAAARGVTLVEPERDPAKVRGYAVRALSAGLRPLIGQRFPLDRAADAHAAIEARATVGKTLLTVAQNPHEDSADL